MQDDFWPALLSTIALMRGKMHRCKPYGQGVGVFLRFIGVGHGVGVGVGDGVAVGVSVEVAVPVTVVVGDPPAITDPVGEAITSVKKAARSTVTSQGGTPCGP
jgi:hypothetical protein